MARGSASDHIGLKGTGSDVEFSIVRETERAYLLLSEEGQEIWMPKSAFSDDGMLYLWAVSMLEEKLSKGGEGEDDD